MLTCACTSILDPGSFYLYMTFALLICSVLYFQCCFVLLTVSIYHIIIIKPFKKNKQILFVFFNCFIKMMFQKSYKVIIGCYWGSCFKFFCSFLRAMEETSLLNYLRMQRDFWPGVWWKQPKYRALYRPLR